MNASRCWIVEEHIPEGPEEKWRVGTRNRSRWAEWNERRRRANPEIRPEHWRVIRPSGDMWEDVRRKDRMVLTEAMEAIRNLKMAHPKKTLRIRNLRDGNVLMGAILAADIPVVQPNTGSMSPGRAFNNGFSGSKN
jgi:hypothetical protein